jgi:hypothetical protein
MPERVLPEPVSPVMSQPRQKSSRVHEKPFNRTMKLLLVILPFVVIAKAAIPAKAIATTHEAGAGRKKSAPVAISKDKLVVM